jgi:hypothetical protein
MSGVTRMRTRRERGGGRKKLIENRAIELSRGREGGATGIRRLLRIQSGGSDSNPVHGWEGEAKRSSCFCYFFGSLPNDNGLGWRWQKVGGCSRGQEVESGRGGVGGRSGFLFMNKIGRHMQSDFPPHWVLVSLKKKNGVSRSSIPFNSVSECRVFIFKITGPSPLGGCLGSIHERDQGKQAHTVFKDRVPLRVPSSTASTRHTSGISSASSSSSGFVTSRGDGVGAIVPRDRVNETDLERPW